MGRLWRTVKYEEVYLKDYRDVPEARQRPANASSVGLPHAEGRAFFLPPMKRSNEPSTAGGRELGLAARPPAGLDSIIALEMDSGFHHLKSLKRLSRQWGAPHRSTFRPAVSVC